MSSLSDVLAAIGDFRSELFTAQHSKAARLTIAAARAGLRGILGNVVSPLQNIHATGVGIRIKGGRLMLKEFVIKVYVFQKLDGLGALIPKLLSKPFQGVEIDIEELPVMQVRAKRRARAQAATTARQHRERQRPVIGGMEIQPLRASFMGTLGGFVRPVVEPSDVTFALSNNHVLSNANRLPAGTEIVQPVSTKAADVFAKLTNFEPIHLPSPTNPVPPRNRLDAAIARVTDSSLIRTGKILGIPNYSPTLLSPIAGMAVTKSGRTTGVTTGRITATNVEGIQVNYAERFAPPLLGTFDGCIQILGDNNEPFSASGDSGSFILEKTSGRPVALLFAGSGNTTSACDMTAVCTRFNVLPV